MKISGIKPFRMETVADKALKIKNRVNLGKLCEENFIPNVSNFKLKDGSVIKLLEGSNEVDCVVMKNGNVLTAKGTFVKNSEEAGILATRIIEQKIANRPDLVETSCGRYF